MEEFKNMDDNPKQFVKRLFGFSAGPIISALISMIIVPITTYFVVPAELGKSAMYTMGFTISSLFVYLGMDQSFVREFNAEKDKKRLLWNSFFIPFIFSIFLGIFYIIFYKPISILMFGSVEYFIIILLSISLPFAVIDRFNMLLIRMEEKARLYSALNVINKLINIVVLVAYLKFIDRSFKGIIISTFINLVLMCLVELYINRNYLVTSVKINKELVHKLLRFGIPLIPASILTWLFNSMDKLAMRKWSNFNEIGLYSAAFKIVLVLGIVQQAFSTFWAPTSYRWYEEKVPHEKYEKVSCMLATLMSCLFALLILFKDIIIKILGSGYYKAAPIIPFLLFYPLMYTISETTTLGIGFSRKTGYNVVVSGISALVNYIGNYMLVPKYGAVGASISTGISYIVFFWLRTLISRKLWYNFKVGFYFVLILLLLGMAFTDVIFDKFIFDLIFTLAVIFICRKYIKEMLKISLSFVRKN